MTRACAAVRRMPLIRLASVEVTPSE